MPEPMSDEQEIRDSMSAALDAKGVTPEQKERAMAFLDWCLCHEHYVVPVEDEDGDG